MSEATAMVIDNGQTEEAQIVTEEPDAPALCVSQVLCALSLGMAPIVSQAKDALHQLLRASGEEVQETLAVEDWVQGVVARELANARARALWPHPPGTPVEMVNEAGSSWMRTTTKSAARALPSGEVLVNVEHKMGGVMVQELRVAT